MSLVNLKRGGILTVSLCFMETDGKYSRQVAKQTDKQHIGQSTSKNIDWRNFLKLVSQRYKAGQKPDLKTTTLLQWYKKSPQ